MGNLVGFVLGLESSPWAADYTVKTSADNLSTAVGSATWVQYDIGICSPPYLPMCLLGPLDIEPCSLLLLATDPLQDVTAAR